MVGGVAEFSTCEENEAKAESVKYSIYTKVSDELIICNNCFSAIKAVGRYGQVNLLSGSRKQVQKWNPRHCRTWVLCKVFSRDSRMPSPTSRQSCVANHLTDIFDSVLTYCPTNSSGYRHGPCVTLSMVSAKGKSAKLNSHYGINSGEIVCLNRVTVMRECSFLNVSSIPALTAYEYRGYIISDGQDQNLRTAPRQSVLFTSGASSDRSSRFRESRANCSKLKSRPSNME